MGLSISSKGLKLIKKYEGCRLTAYQDSVGVWTIGYGTTNADKSITGLTIKKGVTITQAQATKFLKKSVNKKYAGKVNKYYSTYHFNQNQFDALVSFAYNIGSIDQLTANGTRSIDTISTKILAYDKAGGKTLAGLTKRRKDEKALFDTPAKATVNKDGGLVLWKKNGKKIKKYKDGKKVTVKKTGITLTFSGKKRVYAKVKCAGKTGYMRQKYLDF